MSIKRWREARGLSAEQLAIRLGVGRMTVYNWESGATRPADFLYLALMALGDDPRRLAAEARELIEADTKAVMA